MHPGKQTDRQTDRHGGGWLYVLCSSVLVFSDSMTGLDNPGIEAVVESCHLSVMCVHWGEPSAPRVLASSLVVCWDVYVYPSPIHRST